MQFKDLPSMSKKKKGMQLFSIFDQLNSDMREAEADQMAELFKIYSGNDETHKEELKKFFNSEETVYDSLEFNSNIKSLISKYIQPFFSKDQLVTFAPLNENIEVIERVSKLINDQIKSEDFVEELVKCVKDSCIYGKAFMSLGWSVEQITIPKKTRTVQTDPTTGKEISEQVSVTQETTQIEKPDFRAERVSDILYPKVSRWEDVPYVLKLERVSPFTYNSRYGKKAEEILTDRSSFDDYQTELDNMLESVPGAGTQYSDAYENEVTLVHFYFADGSYYVGRLDQQTSESKDKTYYYGLEVIYEGSTPIPGVPIPIYFLNLEPITGRLSGESLINVGKNEHRKLMEADNHHLKILRKVAGDNLIISEDACDDLRKITNRKPGEPIMMEGDLKSGIMPFPSALTPEFIQTRQIYKGTLDSTLGVNDFFQGNIGRSARLTGVDSLLSNALSRLTVGMNQISKFLLKVVDGLVLANRAFLPRTFVQIDTSLHVTEPISAYEIPYPLQAKISSPVDGGADLSVKLGSFYQFLQLAMTMEQSAPGTYDLMGLIQYGFSMAGLPEVKRFMLKAPFTQEESKNLEMIDKMMRLLQQSALPNNENPFGSPIAPQGQEGGARASQNQQKMDTTGQNMAQGDIGEIGNF